MQNKDALDSLLAGVSEVFANEQKTLLTRPITIWVTQDQKEKFDQLQTKTKRKFVKKLREVIVQVIDRVEAEAG